MKIFPLFGKKQAQADTPAEDARARDGDEKDRRAHGPVGPSCNPQFDRRSVARATELKIDAIESAMSLHLDGTAGTSGPVSTKGRSGTQAGIFQNTVPLMDVPTEILFDDGPPDGAVAAALPPPAIEEAAILYANDQQVLAEQLLQDAITEATPATHAKHAYLLLFDLYQLSGQQQAFDSLSTGYISRFETSPPAWRDSTRQVTPAAPAANLPSVIFPAVLGSNSAPQVERAQQLSAANNLLRLDFSRIRETDPAGCALLLQLLHSLRSSGHDLILPGAPQLIERIKATLQAGRRDASAAPWLLLLELLRLLNREQEFEESSIEYCITFEISPPAFEAPRARAIAAAVPNPAASQPESFLMPNLVAGDIRQLLKAIIAFAVGRETVAIDCSQLNRIDFSSSGQLLTGLVPLADSGKIIEFHGVNYPVAALLDVMGVKEIARIIPYKG